MFIAFKMAHFCCFSFGGNLGFPPKNFITLNNTKTQWANMCKKTISAEMQWPFADVLQKIASCVNEPERSD